MQEWQGWQPVQSMLCYIKGLQGNLCNLCYAKLRYTIQGWLRDRMQGLRISIMQPSFFFAHL